MSAHPNESWMARCSGRTKLTPLEFCFPGTHDTGAYQKPDFNIIASNESMASSTERFAPGFQDLATRWALAQPGQSIYDQLMNGVRFLDFRISYAKDEQGQAHYYLIHTFVISKLDTVMDDIDRFLAAHPTELIIIDMELYYQVPAVDLQHYMYGRLGHRMYMDESIKGSKITLTVDQITKSGRQIICFYNGPTNTRTSLYYFMKPTLVFYYPFMSVDNVPAKQAYIKKSIDNYFQTKSKLMFQLTYTLTEVAIDVATSIFAGGSLKKYADTMNPTQVAFVNGLTRPQRDIIRIITNDDQVNSDNVKIAMGLIAERVASATPVERPLQAVQSLCSRQAPHHCQSTAVSHPEKTALAVANLPADTSAWASHRPSKSQSVAQQRKKTSLLRRVCSCLCCCCCNTGSSSDNEDDMPLVQ